MVEAVYGHRPPTRRDCVRCGRRPRTSETYVCADCLADRQRIAEQEAVAGLDYAGQRRELIKRFHWAGGWPRD